MAFREIEEAGFDLGTFMATYEERLTELMKRVDKIEQGLEGIKKERKNMNEEVTKLHKELCKERSEAREVVAIYEYMKERENEKNMKERERTSSAKDSPPLTESSTNSQPLVPSCLWTPLNWCIKFSQDHPAHSSMI